MTDTVEAIVAEMRDRARITPTGCTSTGPIMNLLNGYADRLQFAHAAEVEALREAVMFQEGARSNAEVALAVAESRLREAERAIAEAPRVEITACNQIAGASDFDFGDMASAALKFKPGQFVAIVPIDRAMEGAE